MEKEKIQESQLNMFKKIAMIFLKILYDLLVVLCVILIAVIVMQRITDSNGSIKGYKIFRVVSGSMIPKFDVGEVVICKEIPANDIKVGNAIVYRGKIGELFNKLVMHEVVGINHDETDGSLEFYAKGINNNEEDPEVKEDQILGVVVFKSGILTVLYSLATSIYSSFIIVTILVLNVFISFKSNSKEKLEIEEDEYDNYLEEENDEVEVNDLEKHEENDKELENELEEDKSSFAKKEIIGKDSTNDENKSDLKQ